MNDFPDLVEEYTQDARHKDMLRLLEKIPFADPSMLMQSYQVFGQQVYNQLQLCDVEDPECSAAKCPTAQEESTLVPTSQPEENSTAGPCATVQGNTLDPNARFKDEHTQNVSAVVTDSISLTVQDPEFVLDHKYDETAVVDNSSGVHETCMPCSAPKVEALPMEEPLTDYLWSDFSEDIPLDSPAQSTPREHCIPKAFEENFSSVLYSSCESYQKWLTNAVGVIQSNRQLVVKYDVVATMPTDFPNPLSQAECVSLVMAYEFCRISGLEGREVTLHDWMCPQTGSEEGVSICKFAGLTLLGGVCFFAHSTSINGEVLKPDKMFALLQQAVSSDDLAIAQMVINWQNDAANCKDMEGWTPLHFAAKANASTMIHLLCDKAAEKEATTTLGNTPLLVAALTGAEDAIKALVAENVNPNVANVSRWTPVHYAAVADNVQLIERLYQHGGALHNTTVKGNSPLSLAIMNDSVEAATLLIKKSASLSRWKNSLDWTTLHLAASKNATRMLQLLIKSTEVDLNAVTRNGHTSLALAVLQACKQAVTVLLDTKAKSGVCNSVGWSVLHMAAEQNACHMICCLCEAGADTEALTLQGNTPLCIAAMNGCSDAAAELLKQKANPNARNESGWSAVHYSAAINSSSILKHIGQAADVNWDVKTNEGSTALLLAVTCSAQDSAKILVDAGADAKVKGPEKWSPLHFAVNQDDHDLIDLLCNGGANVNAICEGDKTPLMIAVMNCLVKSVRAVLEKSADPNLRDVHGWTAVHMAAESNETVEILQLLVYNGAYVDGLTNKGNTALAVAVLNNSMKTAKALLLSKADPNKCGDHLWSPLHIASERSNAKLTELLCSFGANPNATNHQGYTPLMISVAKSSRAAVGVLLRNNANPNMQSELNGWSALHLAAQEDDHVSGELLCNYNADLNVRTHESNTSLVIAAMKQSKCMVSTLLSRKADVNVCDSNGWTALHCVTQVNAAEMIPILWPYFADCEVKTNTGNTPLSIAVMHNSTESVHKLLKLNADVDAKNCKGWTPLCFAVHNGAFDVELIGHLCSPINVSMQTEQCKTPLHLCVFKRNTVYTKFLLKCGADPSIRDIVGNSPLKIALCSGPADIADALLEHTVEQECISYGHADVKFVRRHKHSAKQCAAQERLAEDVNLLQAESSESIDYITVDANTPLHIAVQGGQHEIVKRLLEQNSELANMPNKNGYLPIQSAVMGNQPAIIEQLSHYCDAQGIMDHNGYTLLHLAAKHNSAQAAKQLLSDGHYPDAKDGHGYCPIHVAAFDGSIAVIEVFVQYNIGLLSLQGRNGFTVMHCAAQEGKVEVVEFICNNYPSTIDINAVANMGNSPLHVAAISTSSSAAMIKALCMFGADVTQRDAFRDVPLHCAVLSDDEEKVRVLLSINSSVVDTAGASGETPLHWAVKKLRSKMIDILCGAKCDINAGDEFGNTPLHLAVSTHDEDIVQKLLAWGAAPEKHNTEGVTPLDFAAVLSDQNCFKVIYNESQKAYCTEKSYINMYRICMYAMHHQMEKAAQLMMTSISKVQYGKYLKDRHEPATTKVTLVGIMKMNGQEATCQSPCKVLLDKCIFGKKVIRCPALFEADTEGNLPGTRGYRKQDGSFLSNLVKNPKVLFAVADHPALQAYVSYRWGQIARPFFWRGVIFSTLQLFLLTFALASAARPDLPLGGGYRDPIDIFRGISEAAILIFTLVTFVSELSDIINNCKGYPLSYSKSLQWCYVLLILLLIPLRILAHPGQWIVAALAYGAFTTKAFGFLLDSSYFGVYIQALIVIFWRDIFKFIGLFGMVLVGHSGTLYFSLRYDADVANSTTANLLSGEGRFLSDVFFWALRFAIGGDSTLDYSSAENVIGPLTIILYLLFLLLVVIILLNVLIAQVSETYTAVQSTARASLLYNRSKYIVGCEETIALWFLLWTCNWKRIRLLHHIWCDVESEGAPQCCKCLRHKVVREVFYCHDDDAMYWPGQLFHKNKNGKYLDLSLRARFGRRIQAARKLIEKCFYPRIVSAYDETYAEPCALEGEKTTDTEGTAQSSKCLDAADANRKELQQIGSLLVAHEEAYQAQCAAMHKLHVQMKEVAEIQHATMKLFQQQMEEIVEMGTATLKELQLHKELLASHFVGEADNGKQSSSDDPHSHLLQRGLSQQLQQEIHH